MRKHIEKCNPAAYVSIQLEGGAEVDEEGVPIVELSFREMLPHHVLFTIMVVREWDNLWNCRSQSRREWARSLKKSARLPHRETCIKIMRVIHGVMSRKLNVALAETLAELGDRCIGAQDDICGYRSS